MMTTTPSFGIASIPRAARAAFQWRLLMLWALWMLVPTAILTFPVWQMLGEQLDYSVHAATIAQQLDLTVIADLLAAHGRNAMAFNTAGIVALIATLLISPLLSGMAVTAARSSAVLGVAALMSGALAEYLRMLRMMVWAVIPLGLAAALGGMALDAVSEQGAQAITAADTSLPQMLAAGLMALLLVVAHATLDAGRATLVLQRRRSSVVKAWWQGLRLLLRRPFATLGVYLAISVAGLALAAALAVGRLNIPPATLGGFIGALLVTQIIVVVIGWMRSARLFALVDLARVPR